ncbi:hypothetical protein ACWT_2842 [Actinoplanes sp. SE50]|uniref:hypothetical protein n=1 Tax=unclassified Actinoplanes TaxID=2626549 RepID=UPI00023EC437|nr:MULTISPECIES: hypothetical protein [unclassified Actinoplanes]AEV83599.1 hypothetical protein ACPL_2704 [Actinoplanes sp. SE50/110]ATO82257.1 hypothetical protein ACWT_2842 [Actinoplanes sp. SE50]SLL99664.1 hypothetical protein ACSP50_2895 [Actinoplanes sp. SE50/110]
MNKAKGLLMAAAGVVSGFAVGAAPAQAAGNPPPGFNVDVAGYFGQLGDCQWTGQAGKLVGRWLNYTCDRGDGVYRGLWQLVVRRGGSGPSTAGRPAYPGATGHPGGPDLPGWPHHAGGPGPRG